MYKHNIKTVHLISLHYPISKLAAQSTTNLSFHGCFHSFGFMSPQFCFLDTGFHNESTHTKVFDLSFKTSVEHIKNPLGVIQISIATLLKHCTHVYITPLLVHTLPRRVCMLAMVPCMSVYGCESYYKDCWCFVDCFVES